MNLQHVMDKFSDFMVCLMFALFFFLSVGYATPLFVSISQGLVPVLFFFLVAMAAVLLGARLVSAFVDWFRKTYQRRGD
jgi:Kef-type K+ transport system membrane component KefB